MQRLRRYLCRQTKSDQSLISTWRDSLCLNMSLACYRDIMRKYFTVPICSRSAETAKGIFQVQWKICWELRRIRESWCVAASSYQWIHLSCSFSTWSHLKVSPEWCIMTVSSWCLIEQPDFWLERHGLNGLDMLRRHDSFLVPLGW